MARPRTLEGNEHSDDEAEDETRQSCTDVQTSDDLVLGRSQPCGDGWSRR